MPTPTQWHICELTVWRHTPGHTKDKKMFMLGPLFATFVPALGLSTRCDKQGNGMEKKKSISIFLLFAKQIYLLLFFQTHILFTTYSVGANIDSTLATKLNLKVQHFLAPSQQPTHWNELYANLLKQHIHHLSPLPTTSRSTNNRRRTSEQSSAPPAFIGSAHFKILTFRFWSGLCLFGT